MTDQKNLGCLCWKSGPITASLHTNRTGYVSGELVQFSVEVENLARREMDSTYLSLVEVVMFKAWVKEKWEEREVERLTRQRPAVQRSVRDQNSIIIHSPASVVHSHWSRLNEAQLSLVKMVHSVALPVSLMP